MMAPVRAGIVLSIFAAASTTAFTHEGHSRNDRSTNQRQPSAGVMNEAPPFQTLPPGHSPDDGHDHSGHDHGPTIEQQPPQPTNVPGRVTPDPNINPFYGLPNRFRPNVDDGFGRYDRAPNREYVPNRQNILSGPDTRYQFIPDRHGYTGQYNGCPSGAGCASSSGSICPLGADRRHPPAPVQYLGRSDRSFDARQWHNQQQFGAGQAPCTGDHSCPFGH